MALGVAALGVAAIGVELPLDRPDVEARPSLSAAITYKRPSLKKLDDCSLLTLKCHSMLSRTLMHSKDKADVCA